MACPKVKSGKRDTLWEWKGKEIEDEEQRKEKKCKELTDY